MKSAVELMMERLAKQDPVVKLTEEQKAALAEIDDAYRAKIAEREVFLTAQIEGARAKGDREGMEEVRTQLGRERRRLEEEREEKKAKARGEAGGRPG